MVAGQDRHKTKVQELGHSTVRVSKKHEGSKIDICTKGKWERGPTYFASPTCLFLGNIYESSLIKQSAMMSRSGIAGKSDFIVTMAKILNMRNNWIPV